MAIILCLTENLGISVRLSGIYSVSESDSSKPGKLSSGTGWRRGRGAHAEERGWVFLSVHFLFSARFWPFPKGMTKLEKSNEENTASTIASNWNKSGYSVTQKHSISLSCLLRDVWKKWKHHLMRNCIPHQVMFFSNFYLTYKHFRIMTGV